MQTKFPFAKRSEYMRSLTNIRIGSLDRGEIRIIFEDTEVCDIVQALNENRVKSHGPFENTELGIVYIDRYIKIMRDLVEFPTGEYGTYIRIVPASGSYFGVCIVPRLADEIVLIRQFRHATRRWHLEFVKGFAEVGEHPLSGVGREIAEELGSMTRGIRRLGVLYSDVGLLSGAIHVFEAEITKPQQERVGDFGSATTICQPLAKIKDMIRRGEIDDGLTLATLQLLSINEG